MKKRKDIYVVGYTGKGDYNGHNQPIYGKPERGVENGKRIFGGGQTIQTMTLEEAKEEIKELVSDAPKAIYKLTIVKRFRK